MRGESDATDVIGVWEYDADAETVLTRLWVTDAELRRRVECAVAETGQFIREQLGDAKDSAAPVVDALLSEPRA